MQIVLESLQLEETAAIDLAPVPCVSDKRSKQTTRFLGTADSGVCCRKAMKDIRCTIQSVVGLTGMILGFLLTPANGSETQPVVELLDSSSHHLTQLLGDGASNDVVLQKSLHQHRSLTLLAPVKASQEPIRSKPARAQLTRLPVICETVHAQLQEQLHVSSTTRRVLGA